METLVQKLSHLTGQAFENEGLPPDLGGVRVSDRPDLAQFQCNGAMGAAKKVGKPPRAVAEAVVVRLKGSNNLSRVDIAGPGFINLDVTDDYLAAHLEAMATDTRLGIPRHAHGETVIIDFAQPNVAKPMHVGHLRSSIIGESIKRLHKFAGYNTIGDIHLGDWGTHMGMVISEYIRTGREQFILDASIDDADAVNAILDDLAVLYPKASQESKANPERLAESQAATVRIQNKEKLYYDLWQKIRDVSVIAQKRNFEALDIHFDLWWGESTAHSSIAPMVDDLREKGFAIEDQGAVIISVKRNDDTKEMPPLILYKRDGAVMYGTTDMATLVDRMREYNPMRILYVVDQRQHLHFEQVFRAARMTGIVPEGVELTHAGFGTMNGPDGKPFKTRAGGVMKLEDLIAMGLEKARERIAEAELAQDADEAEREDIAHKVAIAAIKFADLQNQRQSDYIFDLDRLTSFEGKTGPYMLYQAVRIKSLLRKAEAQGHKPGPFALLPEDRALALLLTQLPEAFAASLRDYAPHHLCEYAFRLAQQFSSFYASCHILSEQDDKVRASRLALCAATQKQLELVLGLLGIGVPERM